MMEDKTRARMRRVDDLVGTILSKHAGRKPMGRDDELAKLGLTSIDMVELMLAVESEFDIIIPPTDITTENFRTIASIDRMIARLEAGSGGKSAAAA